MHKLFYIIGFLFIIGILFSSCKKKESGVCYCSYLSGDKKEFDLKHLSRSQQVDTCNMYSQNASHFAGSCDLK